MNLKVKHHNESQWTHGQMFPLPLLKRCESKERLLGNKYALPVYTYGVR